MDSVLNTSKSYPRVSVLMPAYNAGDYINSAIESILSQSYRYIDLIILDDCSNDSTYAKAVSYNDSRIKVLKNHRNLGLARSRNILLEQVSNEYFALQDADDVSYPDRIQSQINLLLSNAEIVAVGTQSNVIDKDDNIIADHLIPNIKTHSCETKVAMLFENPFINTSMMVSSSCINDLKYDIDFPPLEDYEFWSRLTLSGEMVNLERTLVSYRYHEKQTSNVDIESQKYKHIRVWQKYINNIGLSLTDCLASIHWEIAKGKYWDKYSSINDALDYFEVIINANQKHSFLNNAYLVSYLVDRVSRLSDSCPENKLIDSGTGINAISRIKKWGYKSDKCFIKHLISKNCAFLKKVFKN